MAQVSQFLHEVGPRPIGMRRRDLWLVLKEHDVVVEQSMPVTLMADIAEQKGVDFRSYDESKLETLRQKRRAEIRAQFGESAPPPAPINIVGDFDGLKMPELRKRCKDWGIAFSPSDKKVDLIEKLRGYVT